MALRTIEEKLNAKLQHFTIVPTGHFSSQKDFLNYLSEGAMLNINKVCSEIFSIPYGKYVVWEVNNKNAILLPLSSDKPTEALLPENDKTYDIVTNKLIANWQQLGMINEDEEHEHNDDSEFVSKVDMSTVDRTSLATALENAGMTVSELADRCGVDAPAISRILRKPSARSTGDPGGRNPSMGLASKVCAVLRIDPKIAFPDFFSSTSAQSVRKPPKNRGSGAQGGTKGHATDKWTQGNVAQPG